MLGLFQWKRVWRAAERVCGRDFLTGVVQKVLQELKLLADIYNIFPKAQVASKGKKNYCNLQSKFL